MKPVIIISIAFVLLIPINAYAIDYRDSTGYTPSWAIGQEYHYVLNECNYLIGDTSRDGNWCNEWVAYVLDQGVENFPESTSGVSSTSNVNFQSERICTENKICAFPGEFLKYINMDTFDDFEEIAIVEFKEKINDNTIRVFIDGFGSKPLTYNLNLKTGIETHNEYKNVNRPFNLLEPIPMKIGQQVSQYMEGYYESTIETEKTVNLKDLQLMDIERTLMMAKTDLGNGDSVIRVYDKETGVLITQVDTYQLDGKQYNSGIVLIDTNIFSVPTVITTKQISIPKIVPESTPDYADDVTLAPTLEPTKESVIQENVESPSTPIPTISEQKESSSTEFQESSDSDGFNVGYFALGFFVIVGIPAIIIGIIVWKIKRWRAKRKLGTTTSI